jgi:folylpolyglutamate synthase/dihydropteroate synthase
MLAETAADGAAVCCGSLYLLGDVVQSLEKV